MENSWEDWRKLTAVPDYSCAGVYKIRALEEGNPIRIHRLLSVDGEGVLCIGSTNNIERRIRYFNRGITGKDVHSEAHLLYLLRRFTIRSSWLCEVDLECSISMQPSEFVAQELEASLIKRYVIEFGEPPPLNSAIPKRKDMLAWEQALKEARCST